MATLKFLAVAALLGYLCLAALVWLAQERLMFMPHRAFAPASPPTGWRLEDVRVAARDGTRLAGVLVKPAGEARLPLVIYYGGNAEEVTAYAAAVAEGYGPRAVLLVNYRGYGESQGSPGEKALVADAREIFDWAAARPDVDPARIALHGRSLGSGVAVQVAAASNARCVILTSPFASALQVARAVYPWLPVAWLMRHPFDSMAHASTVRVPALFVMGEADDLIPVEHSEQLAAAWGGTVERLRLKGFGHNDVGIHPSYNATVRAFLDRCL